MATTDWRGALDFDQAAANVRSEFPGDWYRDPWGWPEIDHLLKDSPKILLDHLDSKEVYAPALIDVPKEGWMTRPAVVLPIIDRMLYQTLVDRLSVDLIGNLHRSSYGWRMVPGSTVRGAYSHNDMQWKFYRDHLKSASTFFDVGLRTDLVSCFASIPLEPLRGAIDGRIPKGKIGDRLHHFIGQMYNTPSRSGLPQRSLASAVIANMYMSELDDIIDQFSFEVPGFLVFPSKNKSTAPLRRSWTRWMDDIWLFGHDPAQIRQAQMELQRAVSSLGMYMNSSKTDVLEGDVLSEVALQVEHSAVDSAIDEDGDHGPLEVLIDRLLLDPSASSRTSLRFAVTRMRNTNSRYRIDDLLLSAHLMPHAADILAPLFASAYTISSLQDWFLDYASGEWAAFEWSVGHYLQMFPSSSRPRKSVREFAVDKIGDSRTSVALLGACAQRLSSWDAAAARAVFHGVESTLNHPQQRRIVSLAGLGVGVQRAKIRKWLNQADNRVTLDLVERRNFIAPKVKGTYL
ncbi:RNA-directed DNA polymerase [Williamsia sp. SKLECPSW1]